MDQQHAITLYNNLAVRGDDQHSEITGFGAAMVTLGGPVWIPTACGEEIKERFLKEAAGALRRFADALDDPDFREVGE